VILAALVISWLSTRPTSHHTSARDSQHTATNASGPPGGARSSEHVAAAAARAARWAAANLPPGSAVLASNELRDLLTGLRRSASCPSAGFLLADGALRSQAARERNLADCLTDSVPIARFETGIEVRQITPDAAAAARARTGALDDRRRGGMGLASNPAITMPDTARRLLRAGRLDLRAAAVLAALAERHSVRIAAVVGDPAEIAAGLPARTLDLAAPGVDVLTPVLAAVTGDYRPARVIRTGAGAVRLVWSFRATPPDVLH
jgi:hypothetical protein